MAKPELIEIVVIVSTGISCDVCLGQFDVGEKNYVVLAESPVREWRNPERGSWHCEGCYFDRIDGSEVHLRG